MHQHVVFFWLDPECGTDGEARFERGLHALLKDPNISASTYGRPAASEVRGVVDASYSFGMVLSFADTDAHDRYQVSDIHKRFIADCSDLWTRVQVYDVQT